MIIDTFEQALQLAKEYLVGHRGFRSNAWLITDEEGRMLYGSYAYVYKKDWWDKIVEKEQEKEDEEED